MTEHPHAIEYGNPGVRSVVKSIDHFTDTFGEEPIQIIQVNWVRLDLRPIQVRASGMEAPLYQYLTTLFPNFDLSTVAGVVLDIATNSYGDVVSIGCENHGSVSIREELIKANLPVD